MKKHFVKIVLCIVLALTTITFFAFVQSSQKTHAESFVTVKVIESSLLSPNAKSRIVVSDAKAVIKSIPLEIKTIKNDSNPIIVNATFEELKAQGYKLISSNAVGENGVFYTTYIFEK